MPINTLVAVEGTPLAAADRALPPVDPFELGDRVVDLLREKETA